MHCPYADHDMLTPGGERIGENDKKEDDIESLLHGGARVGRRMVHASWLSRPQPPAYASPLGLKGFIPYCVTTKQHVYKYLHPESLYALTVSIHHMVAS